MSDITRDSRVHRIVEEALLEDIGMGDVTTEAIVPGDLTGTAEIRVKESGVIAGLGVAKLVFRTVDADISFTPAFADGSFVEAGRAVATVQGSLAGILKAERTALNILQRMSGIATLTRKFVDAVKGTGARITDTRKTSPGMRILDKLAVRLGGGVNHRFGLDDMVLIKDNHIAAAGGISAAIDRCVATLRNKDLRLKVEVETENCAEVRKVIKKKGVHRIMLDNFPLDEMKKAVGIIGGTLEVEASGNVTLATVRSIAATGVNFISVGALTHSAPALDIALDIHPGSSRKQS